MDKVRYIAERLPLLLGFGGLALYSLYDLTTITVLRALKKRDEQLEEQRKMGPNREQKRKALKEEMRLAEERKKAYRQSKDQERKTIGQLKERERQ